MQIGKQSKWQIRELSLVPYTQALQLNSRSIKIINNSFCQIVESFVSNNYRFTWNRVFVASSEAEITWDIPLNELPGLYRIRHFGHYKSITGEVPMSFEGQSRAFRVLPNTPQNQKEITCSSSYERRPNILSVLLSGVLILWQKVTIIGTKP